MRSLKSGCLLVLFFPAVLCQSCNSREAGATPQRLAQRGETVEAVDMLDKIAKGASDYLQTPRVQNDGTYSKMACQYPDTVVVTPGLSCCDAEVDKDKDQRCDEDPIWWADRTWAALKFQVGVQHHYRYEFTSSGTGLESTFVATAYGDLDCDGVESTFRITGKAQQVPKGPTGPGATECRGTYTEISKIKPEE